MLRHGIFLSVALLSSLVPGVSQTTSLTQSTNTANSAPTRSLRVPADAPVLGKLLTNLESSLAKVGDSVDVQILEDIKAGHDDLVKKGSILNGHVTSVQPFTSKDSQCVIGILFDRITLKNSEQVGLNLTVHALAPQMDVKSDSLVAGGRSATQIQLNAAAAGKLNATTGSVDTLSHKSVGVYAMPGVSLATQTENGQHISLVQSTSGDIRLKKGMQLVLLAVN